MSIVRSPVRSVVRSPVRGVFGGGETLLGSATSYLAGVAPYHWFDFVNDRALYAGVDVGAVSGATGYSFSRASTGYYTNADGTLTSFASGALRRGDRGVLIEGARTNLCLQSQTFDNASWSKTGSATVTANQAVAPDGTTTADTLNVPATGDRITATSISASATTTYVFSVWLAGSGTINITINTNGGTFKTATSQLTLTSTLTRYTVSITTNSDNTGIFAIIGRYNGTGNTGTATSATVWGAQVEQAALESSYIPTTTASATRAADVLTCTAGVSYPLSLWAEFVPNAISGTQTIFSADAGTADRTTVFIASGGLPRAVVRTGAVTQADVTAGSALTANTTYKVAARSATNSVQIARGGTLGTADTSVTAPPSPTNLAFGSFNGADQLFGYITRAAVFNSALSDANLQSVST